MIVNILAYEFMQRALIGGALVAITCAVLGVFLVLKRLSLLGDSLAHVAFAGVALGLLFGLNPVLSALVLTVCGALGVQEAINHTKVYGETATAIMLSVGLAIAILLIGIAKGFNADVLSYLFGSILALSTTDLILMMGILLFATILIFIFYKKLIFGAFNLDIAKTSGVNTNFIDKLFIILVSMSIVIGMRAVGILLVSALFVMPTAAALQISRSFKSTILWSVLIAVLCVETGIVISFYLDLPPSGVIVILLLIAFVLATLGKKLIGNS